MSEGAGGHTEGECQLPQSAGVAQTSGATTEATKAVSSLQEGSKTEIQSSQEPRMVANCHYWKVL